jgi:mono/diheme cytochrome c family protein
MLSIASLVLIGLCAAAALLGLRWARSHGFSARVKPSRFETLVAGLARSLAIPTAVRGLKNPLEPTALRLARARDHFADHCATCHANDGSGRTMINAGLYPPAPDLRSESTQGMRDGEMLHVIREGVRFTGMPGWGGSDEENWELILFVRHLPTLSIEELSLMREVNGERY